MNRYDKKWEQQINALLDGELGEEDAEALKSAATDDRELARAIVEAFQLQRAMDGIRVERVPASLAKRLRAIPREQRPATGVRFFQPRWVMAYAAIPLVIIALSMMPRDRPSASEVAEARHELAVAFAYLDKAGAITGREIKQTIRYSITDALGGSVNRTIKLPNVTSKEKKA